MGWGDVRINTDIFSPWHSLSKLSLCSSGLTKTFPFRGERVCSSPRPPPEQLYGDTPQASPTYIRMGWGRNQRRLSEMDLCTWLTISSYVSRGWGRNQRRLSEMDLCTRLTISSYVSRGWGRNQRRLSEMDLCTRLTISSYVSWGWGVTGGR